MRKLPALKDFKHIAIIQTAFLGDVALALPLAQAIKNLHPDVQLSFITTPSAASLVACCTAVDNVITYDKHGLQSGLRGIRFIGKDLSERKVDCVLALHRSFRTTFLTYLAEPNYSVAFDINVLALLFKKRISYKRYIHEVERNLSLLKGFSNFDESIINAQTVNLEIDADDKEYIDSKLQWLGLKNEDKIILIAPGSIWNTKRWLPEYYTILAGMLINKGYKIILSGSKDDKILCDEIANKSNSFNMAGETSIPQTLYLMQKANLVVTNDSSPTHFANLVNCPVVTIFGPTSPIFGFGARGERDKVVEIDNLKCRPCKIHGSKKCPINTHECMVKISPEMVFKACEVIIKE
ncbi:MAG: lipopolysaccharide heptosyltransferase II [FCB group bacterium]|jgi:heptosyltransferase-2